LSFVPRKRAVLRPVVRAIISFGIGLVVVGLVPAASVWAAPLPANNAEEGHTSPDEPLPRGVLMQLGDVLFRGDCAISGGFFTPDGKYLIAHDAESKIWIWSVATGRAAKQLSVPNQDVRSLWFSGQSLELHCYTADHVGRPDCLHLRWHYPDWAPLPNLPVGEAEQLLLRQRGDPHLQREIAAKPNQSIVVQDAHTEAALLVVPVAAPFCPTSLSEDQKLLLMYVRDEAHTTGRVEVWNVDRKQKLQEWPTGRTLVNKLVASSDDSIIAASGMEVHCWDLKLGRELVHLVGGPQMASALACSPENRHLAIAFNSEVQVYDIPSGRVFRSLPTHGFTSRMFFSPDGRLLAIEGANSPVVYMFDLQAGQWLLPQEGSLPIVDDLAYSLDGKRLAVIDSWHSSMAVWDLPSRRPLRAATIADPFFAPIIPADHCLSGDGSAALIGRSRLIPSVWKLDEGPFAAPPSDLAISPLVAAASRQNSLFAAVADGSLELVSFGVEGHLKQVRRRTFRGHAADVLAVAISADGRTAASLTDNGLLQIQRTDVVQPPVSIELSGRPQRVLAMSDDGTQVAAIVRRRLSIWRCTGGDPVASLDLDDDAPSILRFSSDNGTIILGAVTGRICLYSLAKRNRIADRLAHPGGIAALAMSADGTALYSGDRDGGVAAWKATTLESLAGYNMKIGPIFDLTLLEGNKLVASDESGAVVTWDLASGKELDRLKLGIPAQLLLKFSADKDGFAAIANVRGSLHISLMTKWLGTGVAEVKHTDLFAEPVAFSPDGKLIARATPSGIRTWLADSRKAWHAFHSSESLAKAIVFSPSGRLIATGGDGLGVWRAETGTPCFEIPRSDTGMVTQVLFSPDERFLLSSDWDDRDNSRVVMGGTQNKLIPYLSWHHDWAIWDVNSGKLLRKVRLPRIDLGDARFSGDGRLIVASKPDDYSPNTGIRPQQRRLAVWEAATGMQLGEMPLPHPGCSAYAISADGRQIATVLPDGRIWICDFTELLKPILIARDPGDSPLLAELWNRLGSTDPLVAYRAINRMCEKPEPAIKFLLEHLLPGVEEAESGKQSASPDEIRKLIEELQSNESRISRRASSQLLKLGAQAHPEIRAALDHNPPDRVRERLKLILAAPGADPRTPPPTTATTLQQLRAVQVLERIGTPAATEVLKSLASGPTSDVAREAEAARRRLAPPSLPAP
jgi:WD40 repeat protein